LKHENEMDFAVWKWRRSVVGIIMMTIIDCKIDY